LSPVSAERCHRREHSAPALYGKSERKSLVFLAPATADLVARLRPDVAILAVDGVATAEAVMAATPCPIVPAGSG
jgi:DeoR/GlpR family transcriptional regulator of sugar metabolism